MKYFTSCMKVNLEQDAPAVNPTKLCTKWYENYFLNFIFEG